MTDRNDLLDHAVDLFPAPEGSVTEVHRDLARRRRNRKLAAAAVVVGIWLVIGALAAGFRSHEDSVPADDTKIHGIFSSVGGWIVFEHDGRLRAIAPDGSEQTMLFEGRNIPSAQDWSPDGSRLLVKLDEGCCFIGDLAVIEPNGSETTLARFNKWDSWDGASFSPDGATVVYAGTASAAGDQLWTVPSDGSQKPRLLLESKSGGVYQPSYSPDGTQIAYVDGGGDNSHTIRVVNADGTNVRVLINATPPFDGAGHIVGLEWSPDGSVIAVALDTQGIYTIHPDGTGLRLLIPAAEYPVWSPDGSLIAYRSMNGAVWIANADGSDPRQLTWGASVGPWNPGTPADRS